MTANRTVPGGMLSGRVLVVEDHAFNRRAIEVQLGRWGVSCVAVASAEEALDVLRRQHFDLLVTDLHLPEMSGTQLAERVRDVSSIPLVLLTGREDMRHAAATAGSPFDAVLIKESRFDALYLCLWKLLPRAARGPSVPLPGRVHEDHIFDFSELDALASRGVDVPALVRDWRRVLDDDMAHLVAAQARDDAEAVRKLLHRIGNSASVFKARGVMALVEHAGAASPAFMMRALDGIAAQVRAMEAQIEAWCDGVP
ncbi:response regulator [Paraburkholderia saeva]|uniref:response regulator n=1 Tax=Paraburkholderia saeva TaxID=2777537 RepID=UPI001DF8C202|nr:response regulator [Paraburkholderia saeva]CAG4885999.1 Sensor histidine kinase RcsC [Paraburkholderia saeva]